MTDDKPAPLDATTSTEAKADKEEEEALTGGSDGENANKKKRKARNNQKGKRKKWKQVKYVAVFVMKLFCRFAGALFVSALIAQCFIHFHMCMLWRVRQLVKVVHLENGDLRLCKSEKLRPKLEKRKKKNAIAFLDWLSVEQFKQQVKPRECRA